MIPNQGLSIGYDIKVPVLIYVVLLVFILIGSVFKARKFGGRAGDGYRKKGFVIITIVGFGLFLVLNRETFTGMFRSNAVDDLGKVEYGNKAKIALNALRTEYTPILSSEDKYPSETAGSSDIGENEISSDMFDNGVSSDKCEIRLLEDQELPNGLVEIKPISVVASGTVSKRYPAQHVTDSNSKTSWQVTVSPKGQDNEIDEWLAFILPEECYIEYIVILNGTSSSEKHYLENARAKKINISGNDSENLYVFEPILLPDQSEENIIECTGFKTNKVFVKLKSVYPGSTYPEVGITDISFYKKIQ